MIHDNYQFSSLEKLTKSSLIDNVIQGDRNSLSGDEIEIITTFTDLDQMDNYFLFEFGDKGNLQPARDLYINGNSFSFSYFIDKTEIPDSKITQASVDLSKGNISIADADIVVSAGRGMKGPENWHLIENLASTLNAATACSKPVSDLGWRPHSEHVGQTGKPVATNLYIAIGISGAIQHLAGVSSSKVKVVINNDPEAPFFKAADYGIVGDAFEVVPSLIEKLKAR